MHFSEEFNALLHFLLIENNNEILQCWITINDIATLIEAYFIKKPQ